MTSNGFTRWRFGRVVALLSATSIGAQARASFGERLAEFEAGLRQGRAAALARSWQDAPWADSDLRFVLRTCLLDGELSSEEADEIAGHLRVRSFAEGSLRPADPAPSFDPAEAARAIKESPLFTDPGPRSAETWIAEAYRRLGEALARLLSRPVRPLPEIGTRVPALDWLRPVVTGAIALGAVLLFVMSARQIRLARRRRRALAALLEEEPARTADEWLAQASGLEREGRSREAVRCLFLACLTRLDEAGILRFVRTETNWEHLQRYERSPARLPGFELRPLTRDFDRIWYGFSLREEDLPAFYDRYHELCRLLARRRSA